MAKNPKMVMCRNCNTEISANAKRCPACGAKNKKPFYLRGGFILLVILVVFGAAGIIRNKNAERQEKAKEYRWPDSELAGLLPKPDSIYGKIGSDSERTFDIDIYKVKADDFEDYVDACKEKGFTADYRKTDGLYTAANETGHSLRITYDDKGEEMGISIYAPSDTDDNSGEDEKGEEREESSSEPPEESTQSPEQSESADDEGGVSDESEETESTSADNESELVDGLRPEFKEAMDSYEAFYEEYFEFMKQYADNPTDITLMKKYTDFVSQMVEADEKFEAWDGDMNDDELKYYMEVQARIYQKLSEIGTD